MPLYHYQNISTLKWCTQKGEHGHSNTAYKTDCSGPTKFQQCLNIIKYTSLKSKLKTFFYGNMTNSMLKIIDNHIFSNSNVPPLHIFLGKLDLFNLCPIKLVDPTFFGY